ncbi:hypothetical protein [Corynebacterium hindlerae]|uniref:hypothetical protein n=1 Tax=Corynebacterium hindlerae TaxID=699041 RepID=UPI0031B6A637
MEVGNIPPPFRDNELRDNTRLTVTTSEIVEETMLPEEPETTEPMSSPEETTSAANPGVPREMMKTGAL